MKPIGLLCFISFIKVLLIAPTLLAQDIDRFSPTIEQWTQETLMNMASDESTDAALLENQLLFFRNPIDINNCEKEDLAMLGILSSIQIDSIFSYHAKHGDLLSAYELPLIEGLDLPTVYTLLPFLNISKPVPYDKNTKLLDRVFKGGRQMALLRMSSTLQTKKGFLIDTERHSPTYQGNPHHLFFRYRSFRQRDFSLGLTLEKDPGEKTGWKPEHQMYGADFSSFHFMLFEKKRWKKFIVGDYHIQAGQGLLLSSGFGLGKSGIQPTRTRRTSNGIIPHTSSMEYGYFRGIATTYQLDETINATGFVSSNLLDASISETDTLGFSSFATSTSTNGLHRTEKEFAKKRNLRRNIAGFHLLQKGKLLKVGIIGMGTIFNRPILPNVKQ